MGFHALQFINHESYTQPLTFTFTPAPTCVSFPSKFGTLGLNDWFSLFEFSYLSLLPWKLKQHVAAAASALCVYYANERREFRMREHSIDMHIRERQAEEKIQTGLFYIHEYISSERVVRNAACGVRHPYRKSSGCCISLKPKRWTTWISSWTLQVANL